jgi:hypothetical protein
MPKALASRSAVSAVGRSNGRVAPSVVKAFVDKGALATAQTNLQKRANNPDSRNSSLGKDSICRYLGNDGGLLLSVPLDPRAAPYPRSAVDHLVSGSFLRIGAPIPCCAVFWTFIQD